LAGALAAKKIHIPVAHVEAGLRSFNMKMPEEINRILVDQISDLLFCPTETAVKNLNAEGFSSKRCSIILSGDVMYDSVLFTTTKFRQKAEEADYVLATVHREENTDINLRLGKVVEILNDLAQVTKVILPLHPRTKSNLASSGLHLDKNISVIEPVPYIEMMSLIANCSLVVTDSGGLQKEAFFLKKPCITLREETEWTELIAAGANIICGTDLKKFRSAYSQFKNNNKINFERNLYGDGNSNKIIARSVFEFLEKSTNQ
jgi:UDP-GlcNAc3NAcA epimerase